MHWLLVSRLCRMAGAGSSVGCSSGISGGLSELRVQRCCLVTFAWQDLDAILDLDSDRDGQLEREEWKAASVYLSEYASTLYRVEANGEVYPAPEVRSRWDRDFGALVFTMTYPHHEGLMPKSETVSIDFVGQHDLKVAHRQHLRLIDGSGRQLWEALTGEVNARAYFSPREMMVEQPMAPDGLSAVGPPRVTSASSPHLALTFFGAGFFRFPLIQ